MARFTRLTARIALLLKNDIDTDQIIPARFLKVTDKEGLGESLFADWRYREDGSENPDFPLNQPEAEGAQILLAGNNFGCGSSREHAPWALLGFGFRAVIAVSFADIFYNNALKNGLLPVAVKPSTHEEIAARVAREPMLTATIDLAEQRLTLPGVVTENFPIDAFAKRCLLSGVDQLGYILGHEERIREFEAQRSQ